MRDKHHLLSTRNAWNSTPVSKELRSKYIYEIDRDTHQELHRDTPSVPLLGHVALFRVLNTIQPVREPRHDIDDLLFAIDKAVMRTSVHPVERDLGYLAMEVIELQRPYIVDDYE